MWNNIGRKIKTLAKVFFWIETALTIISYIVSVVVIATNRNYNRYYGSGELAGIILLGLLVVLLLILFYWLGSFLLCGFGQLIESSEQTSLNTYRVLEQNERMLQMIYNNGGMLNQIREQTAQAQPSGRDSTQAPGAANESPDQEHR